MRHDNHGLRKRCGCARRTWAKCQHQWHFNFKWKGVHHRFSLDRHLGRAIESKTEAETEAEKIRTAIREGTFGRPAPVAGMTLRQLADVYLERYVDVRRSATRQAFVYALDTISRTVLPHPTAGDRAFGDWPVADVTTDTIERFREVRRGQGVTTGVNRNLQSLRALWNWAIRTGYVESSPFTRHSVAVVRISKSEERKRTRRLNPDTDEEARLLKACGPHLRAVVECALQTGMRRGEILSLQWEQVQGMTLTRRGKTTKVTWEPRATIWLPATKTKTKADRWIPISTRLRAILELRRFDPAGEPLPTSAYVFGTAIGSVIQSVDRAWETAVLKSHGHTPRYSATANLTPESRAALEVIDLHLHDLRREAGSRWLEGGVPLHVVRDWLGHTSIAQTSTYLAGTLRTQHTAMAAFERRVQQGATDSRRGGRKRPRTAEVRHGKPNKTGVGRERSMM